MEAKELRIGNWVYLSSHKKNIGEVHLGFNNTNLDLFEPIELTEEWLLKFGFIKECDWKISIGEGAFIWIDENDFTVAIGIPYEASGNQRTMKHVNQLQNLYFALTGEELTIK